jgi:hypothetical protein
MYYAQKNVNKGTVLNPSVTAEYWSFDSKQQRDLLVSSDPSSFATLQKEIPLSVTIKTFDHFKESFSGLFLFPVEKV